MLTEEKPLMKALRRNYTLLSPSSSSSYSPPRRPWVHLRSVFFVIASSPVTANRDGLKSPWSQKRRKHALLPKQWNSLFDVGGRFCDGGIKFLKKVRSGGVDPTLRAEVWPFLLGLFELNSSKEERDLIRLQKREEYDNLQKQCLRMSKRVDICCIPKETSVSKFSEDNEEHGQVLDPSDIDELRDEEGTVSTPPEKHKDAAHPDSSIPTCKDSFKLSEEEAEKSGITSEKSCSESSNSDSSDEGESPMDDLYTLDDHNKEKSPSPESGSTPRSLNREDFSTWQRIIRLDAVRANAEWVIYSPSQSSVSETRARELADIVGLKNYDHLEPCRIFHAARLVAILEAYSIYDPEIGYCQGMSDLLSPIISVIENDSEAFWCFVGFMNKARHNFRLDEVGIQRQLGIISKIIKCKDSHLYSHLEKLEAEDCFFVYRMVVVLFRRELNLEQIFCLWEVMWADQASIRAGIERSAWGRMRLRAPPSDDLLLYAIAACVLQRRKLIIGKYNSMDEIMRECNSMAGHLDVWKLLDEAHDLVVALHDKI